MPLTLAEVSITIFAKKRSGHARLVEDTLISSLYSRPFSSNILHWQKTLAFSFEERDILCVKYSRENFHSPLKNRENRESLVQWNFPRLRYLRPFGRIIHKHNCIFVSFTAGCELDDINSHLVKWTGYWNWWERWMDGFTHLSKTTHHTCLWPFHNISSHTPGHQ